MTPPRRAPGRNTPEGGGEQTRWIYGLNPVLEALRAGSRIRGLYMSAGRHAGADALKAEAARKGVSLKVMHDRGFFDSRFPKGHQGVAAEVEARNLYSIEDLVALPGIKGEAPFFVVLDCIEDPRNLGAVLRTSEAAGVHGVAVQQRRAAPLSGEAAKASAGAIEHIPITVVPNIKLAIERMAEAGAMAVGAEAGPHPAPWEADLSGPLALVIGSEGRGLRRTVAEKCDLLVSLPVRGMVNSLNASVAAGILIYEALRQRKAAGGLMGPEGRARAISREN